MPIIIVLILFTSHRIANYCFRDARLWTIKGLLNPCACHATTCGHRCQHPWDHSGNGRRVFWHAWQGRSLFLSVHFQCVLGILIKRACAFTTTRLLWAGSNRWSVGSQAFCWVHVKWCRLLVYMWLYICMLRLYEAGLRSAHITLFRDSVALCYSATLVQQVACVLRARKDILDLAARIRSSSGWGIGPTLWKWVSNQPWRALACMFLKFAFVHGVEKVCHGSCFA